MITFKEYLTELFDSNVNFTKKIDGTDYIYNFKVDGIYIRATFESNDFDGKDYFMQFSRLGEDTKIKDSDKNEYKIFSTIIEIFKDFISNNITAEFITFEADLNEPSRIKLYDTFQKTINKYTKEFVVDSTYIESHYKMYRFKRINND